MWVLDGRWKGWVMQSWRWGRGLMAAVVGWLRMIEFAMTMEVMRLMMVMRMMLILTYLRLMNLSKASVLGTTMTMMKLNLMMM